MSTQQPNEDIMSRTTQKSNTQGNVVEKEDVSEDEDQKDTNNEEEGSLQEDYSIGEDEKMEDDEPVQDHQFSWLQDEVIECDLKTNDVPELDGDVHTEDLSLYEASVPVPQQDSGLKEASGPNRAPSLNSGLFSCDVCLGTIGGPFRYSCVQCGDFDLCRACEANDHHADHFVLRVPAIKPEGEVRSLLRSFRQVLASAIAPSDDAIDLLKDELKQEEEEEIEDQVLDPLEAHLHRDDQELSSEEVEDNISNEEEPTEMSSDQEAPSPNRLALSPKESTSHKAIPVRKYRLKLLKLPTITNKTQALNLETETTLSLHNYKSSPESFTSSQMSTIAKENIIRSGSATPEEESDNVMSPKIYGPGSLQETQTTASQISINTKENIIRSRLATHEEESVIKKMSRRYGPGSHQGARTASSQISTIPKENVIQSRVATPQEEAAIKKMSRRFGPRSLQVKPMSVLKKSTRHLKTPTTGANYISTMRVVVERLPIPIPVTLTQDTKIS